MGIASRTAIMQRKSFQGNDLRPPPDGALTEPRRSWLVISRRINSLEAPVESTIDAPADTPLISATVGHLRYTLVTARADS